MLYPKNSNNTIDKKLFQNPTSEYRGAPFWAWNCQLDSETLTKQIEYLKEMGFGGFHMHSRTGMATPYLSKEFMQLVKTCVEKAKSENMLSWLYDEDRWPSGSAGGLVTKNPEYRARYLLFTPHPYNSKNAGKLYHSSHTGIGRMENGTLIGRYDVTLDDLGYLVDYQLLKDNETGNNTWYAYLEIGSKTPWFNNQTYVNTLDKNAIDEFISITYEAYLKSVGEDFGKVVPAIFTDEPQFSRKTLLGFADEKADVFLPWTDNLPETFFNVYEEDILASLPELFWELPNENISTIRYRYHDHVTQRFTEAFADNCGKWCREHGLMLTGHMMEEATLLSQTAALGEAMRAYRAFDLPGIDMLCDYREYNTAKQAQSAVHQFGYEGMLSELYGVTNWDFDFRGHKLQGDWQAALGVSVRVPHLSWVSMGGEAKRDYPPSINYQVPWFREYSTIEDHFSRVNTAMTRGKPLVKVAVIHPVESYWIHWGPAEQTASIRNQLETNHSNLTEWLIFGGIDFDFISESLLPEQCETGDFPLSVGQMKYDTVIIPGCQTLRSTTIERLEDFLCKGGNLIIMGNNPKYIDAVPIDNNKMLFMQANKIPFEKHSLMETLEPSRILDIRKGNGERTDNLISAIRKDGDSLWLFLANGRKPYNEDIPNPEDIKIKINGSWGVELFDTLTGDIYFQESTIEKTSTVIKTKIHMHDSLLYHLTPTLKSSSAKTPAFSNVSSTSSSMIPSVPVSLSEPNVMLLDIAEYSFDDGEFKPADEILRVDNKFRKKLNLPHRMDAVAQPWVLEPEVPNHKLTLKFIIMSEENFSNISLALENALSACINLNGKDISSKPNGWYVDEGIQTVNLPEIIKGKNTLQISMPFGRSTNTEWCYLLGDFGVKVTGYKKILTPPIRELSFGDIVPQGLPFYGGNIIYKLQITGNGKDVHIRVPNYKGSLIGVELDGNRIGQIIFAPYSLTIPNLSPGVHELNLILFGNRVNTFGAVHNCDKKWSWHGPSSWRTTGDSWSYEYILKPTGILKSPDIIY